MTAMKMSTIWPAYYALKEKELGSLEEGKFVDFVVIDRDYFSVPEDEIENLEVLMTVLGGKVIFAAPSLGPFSGFFLSLQTTSVKQSWPIEQRLVSSSPKGRRIAL